ncbi:DUF4114 domain-containing protein [Geomonas sp. Red259]|uniref:DUF4114 domain-containing protein n=2 Tax=Geomonas propionica TaxID=2798582 RepID=A0ABS0YV65_9BACT|nr:DUF4114 domain-containing protein [Geomonas propionica]
MQQILDGITEGGTSRVNAFEDFFRDPGDALWTTGGTGSSSATMILEIAGNSSINSFGIYDASNKGNKAPLFNGYAGEGTKVGFSFDENLRLTVANYTEQSFANYSFGSGTFGFYLDNGSETFYSDTSNNVDGFDHMVAYASQGGQVRLPGSSTYTPWLQNEYVLGFEDTFGGGDSDYNDLVLMVESVAPVPEPGTLVLLGAGFFSLAVCAKRRKSA